MRMYFNMYRVMQVQIEEFDLCNGCEKLGICPLIHTLQDDLAVLRHESVRIDKCKLHKKRGHK